MLLAYSRGLISSRKIEQACRENVVSLALACGQQPDHSTLAAFISSMKDESLHLFRDVLLSCEEMNLLGGTMFALDGCKLPSNASKEWSGTLAELRKKKEKIETRVAQLLKEQLQTDQRQDDPPGPQVAGANRQRQVEKLQRKAELIETWLAENQPKLGAAGREKQSNITDNDSATMMTSHGAVQGYNSQALIDGQHPVIVHGGAFGFLGHSLVPHWVVNPNSFVLVGIGGFFAGVAKVQDALEKMARINVNELPVVRQEAPNEIIGMVAKRDIISYYYERSLKWR